MFNEDIEEIELSELVEIFDNCVKISLPNLPVIVLSDEQLDYVFFNPENTMVACDDYEKGLFWNDLFAYVYRLRSTKREMYEDLGFNKY